MLIEQAAVQKLYPHGILPRHLVHIRDDAEFARRVAQLIKLAWEHPRIWVSTTADGRVHCVHCGEALVPMCAFCEENLRVP